jgi:hypothetical protein
MLGLATTSVGLALITSVVLASGATSGAADTRLEAR